MAINVTLSDGTVVACKTKDEAFETIQADNAKLQAALAAATAPKVSKPKSAEFKVNAKGALELRHTDGDRFFQKFPFFALHSDQLQVVLDNIDVIKGYVADPNSGITTMQSVLTAWKSGRPAK